MLSKSIVAAALLANVPASIPAWALVAVDGDQSSVYFVDYNSILQTGSRADAVMYAVSADRSLRLRAEYDCEIPRFRYLDASDIGGDRPGATAWDAVAPDTPVSVVRRYACAGGKIDLGVGDMKINAATPEVFAKAYLALQAKRR